MTSANFMYDNTLAVSVSPVNLLVILKISLPFSVCI